MLAYFSASYLKSILHLHHISVRMAHTSYSANHAFRVDELIKMKDRIGTTRIDSYGHVTTARTNGQSKKREAYQYCLQNASELQEYFEDMFSELHINSLQGIRHFSNPTLRAIIQIAILTFLHFVKLYK